MVDNPVIPPFRGFSGEQSEAHQRLLDAAATETAITRHTCQRKRKENDMNKNDPPIRPEEEL